MLPPTSWMAAFRAAFPFRAAVPLRTETASFRLTPPRRCPGQHFHLSCPPHQQHARPSTRVARPGWPSAWCLSPASYVSDFFFFNLCGLCNCSLLYTLVLKGYTGRLSRSLSLSLLPEASPVTFASSICVCWFPAPRLLLLPFSMKMFLLFGMPVGGSY